LICLILFQVFTFSQVLDSVAFSEFKKSEIFSSLKFIRDVFTFMFIFLFITMIIRGILKITIKPMKILATFPKLNKKINPFKIP
ncbi:hypothetical protein ACMGTR_001718, partial [Campylobacter jejuni]